MASSSASASTSRAATFMPASRRLDVRTKIYVGLTAIVLIGVVAMLYIHRGLGVVNEYLSRLDEIEVPFSTAAFEMEVNSEEYALEILKYLERQDPQDRAEAKDDSADFARYHDTFMRLSTTEELLALGREVGINHRQLVAMGDSLMQKKDELVSAFMSATSLLDDLDSIFEDQLPLVVGREEPQRSRALAAIAKLEAETAETGFWVATFKRAPTTLSQHKVFETLREHASALATYRALTLNTEEMRLLAEVEQIHAQAVASIEHLVANENSLSEQVATFVATQDAIDDLVDEQIQTLALKNLNEPRAKADQAADEVRSTLGFLIPLYSLVAMIGGLLLTLTIVRPLKRLTRATKAIGTGDFAYRIEAKGRDEFDDLATQFNRMATSLQETTVSKDQLEMSEANLRRSLADLQQQIGQRERSEREQEHLRSELRRAEAMATIGALVAGVAHEVRNPLFGITSTLDAMEGQLDWGALGSRYRSVLRSEVDRLNKLMRDLLEYGRPPTTEFAVGKISRVIDEAVQLCAQSAQALGVTIVNRALADVGIVRLNHPRLLQVFVNLIENALHHAPAGSEVMIAATATTDDQGCVWIQCTVEDSGIGLKPDDLPSIFQPFFTRRRGGTGLGLSIAQRIVEEHRGSIVAGNRPQGGAVMTVRFPAETPGA